MDKVLIVDDEYYSRKGLIKIIPWNELHCEVIGEAEDGYKAIEICRDKNPDIIVSDINMAGINGLKLARNVSEFSKAKFIIITGYDDFNYAKGAIKVNAVDFIKKPINIQEFKEAVIKAKQILKKDKLHEDIIKEKLYLQVMRNEINYNEAFNGERENKDIKVVLINNDFDKENVADKNREIIQYIKNWLINVVPQDTIILVPHSNRIALIIDKDIKVNYDKLINEIIQKNLDGITISVSKDGKEIDVHNLYESCKKMLEYSFLLGQNKVITSNYIKELDVDEKYIYKTINSIIENIRFINRKELQKRIDNLFTYLISKGLKKEKFYKIYVEICIKIKEELIQQGIDCNEKIYIEEMEKVNSVSQLRELLKTSLNNAIDLFRILHGQKEEKVIIKVIEYVKENYNKPICLKQLSQVVYLNENYLSRYFKQQIGIGFSEYIRELRISRAKELLSNGKKITTVAKQVGYVDHRQFSINFKKVTGILPKDYINLKN